MSGASMNETGNSNGTGNGNTGHGTGNVTYNNSNGYSNNISDRASVLHPGMVRERTLRRFCREVERRHLGNPYHRWEHAVDVAHTCYALVRRARKLRRAYLSRLHLFCLMVAALAHDMGHQGVSNAHLIKTRNTLALLYNDRSVQENLHASKLSQLCQTVPSADVFELLPDQARAFARRTVIQLLLGTDMTAHVTTVAHLQAIAAALATAAPEPGSPLSRSGKDKDATMRYSHNADAAGPLTPAADGIRTPDLAAGADGTRTPNLSDSRPLPYLPDDDVLCILDGLLRAGDLGNCVKPVHLHARWSLLINREYAEEARMEKSVGLVPPPFMDASVRHVPTCQMEFLELVAAPLFLAMARLVPGWRGNLKELGRNYRFWAAMALHDSGRSPRKRPSRPRLSPTPSAEALLGRSLTRKASRRLSDIIHSIFGNDADSRMSEEGGGEDGGGEGGGKGGSKDGDGNGDSNGDKDGVNVSRDQRWGDALGVSERGWQGEGGVGDAGGDAGGGGGEGTNEGADASPLSKHDSGVRSDFWVSIRGDNRRSGTGGRFSVDVAVLTRRGVGSEREREWERAASALPHPWHALRDAAVAAGNKAGHSHATSFHEAPPSSIGEDEADLPLHWPDSADAEMEALLGELQRQGVGGMPKGVRAQDLPAKVAQFSQKLTMAP